MNYYKISITASPSKQDVIIALLAEIGYDGFEQEEFSIRTYKPVDDFEESALKELAQQLDFSYKTKLIPNQNWNAVWEANFQPIQIGNFCVIRADFHDHFPTAKHEITVNPKMAFGTGHHETTYMMLQQMAHIDFRGKKVLDFGCGTGILSILAEQLGAKSILALDNDPLSFENTKENSHVNNAANIQIQLGELSVVKDSNYDIILANINRNIIFNSLATLYEKTNSAGFNVFSGILQKDEDLLIKKTQKVGFTIVNKQNKGEWSCLCVRK